MKAARVHRFGPPDVIQLDDIDKPEPGPDEVLVAVHAAGVGPWDGWIRSGRSMLDQPLPLTLGSDLSGIVESAGASVTGFTRGDEVYGLSSPRFTGASAEFAAVPASRIARKPRGLSHVEAASVPVVAVTALQMLFEHARVTAGERVLITGAAGNVGAYAVQLARRAGVHVIASVRGDDSYVRQLGADEVASESVAPVDAVIDLVGGDTGARAMDLVRRGGRLVSAVTKPDEERASRQGVTATFMLVDVRTEPLTRIAELFEAQQLTANVGTVLPLADIRVAHEMLEGRAHLRGKIVLAVR